MYLRKSRAEEGQSTGEVLSRHRAALEELAGKIGLSIGEIYEEVVSGEKLYARPEMLRLLDAVRAGNVDAILCMDIDRLGRGGMADQGAIFDAIRDAGALIVTPERTYDLNNDADIEATEFKAFFARAEWRAIRKRMRRGLMQTIEAGGYVANAPYGYRQCRKGRLPTLEIVEDEARFVRYAYERYLSGAGSQTIAAELNAMGSVPRRKAQWSRTTVRGVLRNPTYAGKVVWNRVKHFRPGDHGIDKHHVKWQPEGEWIVVDGAHEAIIPEDVWQRAQERRRERYIPPSNKGQCVNPFSGLIKCSVCGKNMQRMGQSKGDPYLLCNTKGCQASAKFGYVESAMVDGLRDELRCLQLLAAENPKPDTGALEAAIEATDRDEAKISARIPRLYDFLEDGTYDRATFRERLAAAQSELEDIKARRAALTARLEEALSKDPAKTAAELEDLLKLYPTLSPAEKNMALKSLLKDVQYTKPKKSPPTTFTLEIHLKDF